MQIYVHRNNQQLGPFTEAEIRAQLAAGTISLLDHVWWQGQASWLPLGQTSLVAPGGAAPAPAIPPVPERTAPLHSMHATARPTSQLAIWSLVCGCASLFCNVFTSIPAIILGHMGLAETRKNPSLQGHGLALAGTIIGYLVTGFYAAVILFVIVVQASLSSNIKDVFNTITSQLNAAQASNDNDNSSTNTDQSTNAPDQTTPTATPATNADQPTAAPAANDQSTNSATATPTAPESK